MSHEEAVNNLAPERFLLRDEDSPEMRDFEEHLLCCPTCAEDIRAGLIFIANLKALPTP